MKRAAEFGWKAGLISASAIILVDASAAIAILLGMRRSIPVFHFVPQWALWLGGVIFFGYGAYVAFGPTKKERDIDIIPWHHHFGSAFLLAITNPSTYLSFAVIGLMVARFTRDPLSVRMAIIAGFLCGALLWWSTLVFIAFSQRKRYLGTQYIKRVTGIVIMILAVFTCFGGAHEARHFAKFFMQRPPQSQKQ